MTNVLNIKVNNLKNIIHLNFFFKKIIKGICLFVFLPHILDSSAEERNKYVKLVLEVTFLFFDNYFFYIKILL